MVIDGFKLMVIGMTAVFIFLTLMVIIIAWVANLVKPYAHILEEKTPKKPTRSKTKSKALPPRDDNTIIAAVIAAVHKYRQDHKK